MNLEQALQEAVDILHAAAAHPDADRIRPAASFRQLDALIDRGVGRALLQILKLVEGQAENVFKLHAFCFERTVEQLTEDPVQSPAPT